jgi:hypothetical protein
MPRTKPKALPGLGTAAVPHSQETTTQRRGRRGNSFPSLTVVTAGETVAQSVAEAAKDSAFAQNPNDLTIGYSTNSGDDEESDDDEESEYESMTSNSSDNDAEEENFAEDVADPQNYSKLVDSTLLEDDEPTVSYRVDWVKGKGAGQKSIKGRPPKPDTTLMSSAEAKDAIDRWEKDWKRDRDKLRRNPQSNVDGCSFVDGGSLKYTGCTEGVLQPMVNVSSSPLLEGHTFPDKETLLMRVAEEANLFGVWIKIARSGGLQVDVREIDGDPFHVVGYYGLNAHRWKVTKCITRNAGRMAYDPTEVVRTNGKGKGKSCGKGTIPPLAVADLSPPPPNETLGDAFDDLDGIEVGNPDKAKEESKPDGAVTKQTKKARRVKSPMKTKWIVPFFLSAISATPNLPSKEITALLKLYIIDMFLTSALIQKVCQSIQDQVFGNPDTNVTHVHVLRDLLDADNHDFDIYAKTPIEVKKRLLNVVIEQKMNSVKKDGKMMVKVEKLQYLQKW